MTRWSTLAGAIRHIAEKEDATYYDELSLYFAAYYGRYFQLRRPTIISMLDNDASIAPRYIIIKGSAHALPIARQRSVLLLLVRQNDDFSNGDKLFQSILRLSAV